MTSQNFWFQFGCVSAGAAVLLGAFGAHGLKKYTSDPVLLKTWETAAHYHMIHSLALVATGLAPVHSARSGYLFAAGMGLFSGSLYALCLTGNKKLGAITPIGGVALVLGWAALAWDGVGGRNHLA
eukprot:TRINITY_DN14749_c0_g1_i1.p1 TRINITY_DN14749_c0_g1~~TRINITY_DN14749_c0_g1_i1.p1  ORF type:complete len:126 (+),score=13.71 TRINITY_DN14749_c0_g1_i1:79-456(+)